MGVRVSTFGRQMDKKPRPGQTMEEQMKRATHVAGTTTAPDKWHRPSLADRAILGILRFTKKDLTKKKPPQIKGGGSKRTQAVTDRLKQAGLTQSEIDKLRGKKK
jgi:hypothetical protein